MICTLVVSNGPLSPMRLKRDNRSASFRLSCPPIGRSVTFRSIVIDEAVVMGWTGCDKLQRFDNQG